MGRNSLALANPAHRGSGTRPLSAPPGHARPWARGDPGSQGSAFRPPQPVNLRTKGAGPESGECSRPRERARCTETEAAGPSGGWWRLNPSQDLSPACPWRQVTGHLPGGTRGAPMGSPPLRWRAGGLARFTAKKRTLKGLRPLFFAPFPQPRPSPSHSGRLRFLKPDPEYRERLRMCRSLLPRRQV